MNRFSLKVFVLLIVPSISISNFDIQAQTHQNNDSYFNFITAYSPQSSFFLGKTVQSQTSYFYLGSGKKISSTLGSFTSYRTFGIIPFIQFHYPRRDEGNRRDIATGLGISPLGYSFNKLISGKTGFDFGIKSGIMLLNKKFPTSQARRLNYTFDLSVALQHFVLPETSFSLGYKFHHLSNAQTGKHNPGIDSNFIFINIKYFSNGH